MILFDVAAAPPIIASQNWVIATISGAVTIIVAVIGIYGTRHARISATKLPIIPFMERQIKGLEDKVTRRDKEIVRLQRVCWEHHIDPTKGSNIVEKH